MAETWSPFPIIGGAYSDDVKPWSDQDCVNWMLTPAEKSGARSQAKLDTCDGLVLHKDLGTNAPVRGVHDVEGLLMAVSDDKLFRVPHDGAPTIVGTIPGVSRVSMAHNAVNELAIANGQGGYVYNVLTNTFAQITDEGFPGATIFDFIDNYIAGLEPLGRFWFHGELNEADNYNSLDRYVAESAPDKIRSLIVSHREVFVPGERTGEFFRNTGANTGTFQRVDGTEMEEGICSPWAIARLDNTVFWLGEDGQAYRLVNHAPQRISNSALETEWATRNLANVFAMTWEGRGHKVFYLTFPDGHTWGFDILSGEWHRRQSYGMTRWRPSCMTRSQGDYIAGDFANGKLYRLDRNVILEDGLPMVRKRRGGLVHGDGNDVVINGLKLFFNVGAGPVTSDDHVCTVRYLDDGSHNMGPGRVFDLGAAGRYRTMVQDFGWGITQSRVWDIEVSSPGRFDLFDASMMAERCNL